MDTPTPSMRELARQLLALEATADAGRDRGAHPHEAVRVCEKLRVSLTRFAGPDGFASLLRRTLTLACAAVPALQSVAIKPDGTLDGLEQLMGAGAAEAVIATLLGLLVTFIGEPLALRLVRDAWPEASFDLEED